MAETIKPWFLKLTSQAKSTDAKYFTTTKKGEIHELKADLCSEKLEKKKEAVKKVIASMTVGKDVSALFPDVINCSQTGNLELKKLGNLYFMNYAKTHPEMAIMAVNTFAKDCDDSNPLIRALAVRTMGSTNVDSMPSYLADPLRKCLKDEDPYVRKTAVICVAKLHATDPALVEDGGFLELLQNALCDSNPMVVANAVAAMSEILETTSSEAAQSALQINKPTVTKLLTALNECSEWGQICILDLLAKYVPENAEEARDIIFRVTPRLSHSNVGVVLSSVRIIMSYSDRFEQEASVTAQISQKLTPPLITLLSSEPEVQYVALRSINLIVQKRPEILKRDIKVFFVSYNDPIYVKLEKLDVMIRLTDSTNHAVVLNELKEYATEVDMDFVRRAIRGMGQISIKCKETADACIANLLELIRTGVSHIVQESVVVIKDMFRKYPNKYESVVSSLCEHLDTLDEPEARASMIWIIGEYAERIDNADELLESFLQGFHDENTHVQLQLLTAIVKLFLKKPQQTRELVQSVLSMATQESDNPDLRDRGYIYWRLLSTDPNAAKEVVLGERPLISEETNTLEPTLLNDLIALIGTLASVTHRLPSYAPGRQLLPRQSPGQKASLRNGDARGAISSQGVGQTVIPSKDALIGDLLDIGPEPQVVGYSTADSNQLSGQNSAIPDLLGAGLDELIPSGLAEVPSTQIPSRPAPARPSSSVDALAELFGGSDLTGGLAQSSYEPPMELWLDPSNGKSLEIKGTFLRSSGAHKPYMKLQLTNYGLTGMSDFAIQFNKNSFGLIPEQGLNVPVLMPNQPFTVQLPLGTTGQVMKMNPLMTLQVAVKNNVGVFYFKATVPLHILFVEDGEMEKQAFLESWQRIPAQNEQKFTLNQMSLGADECTEKLRRNNVFTVAKRNIDGHDMLFLSLKLSNQLFVLVEIKIQRENPSYMLSLRSPVLDLYPAVHAAIDAILRS